MIVVYYFISNESKTPLKNERAKATELILK